MSATSPETRDEDHGSKWGTDGQTGKVEAANWCYDSGYAEANVVSNSPYRYAAICSGNNSNHSKPTTEQIAKAQGFVSIEQSAESSCISKGYSGRKGAPIPVQTIRTSIPFVGLARQDFVKYECQPYAVGTSIKCTDISTDKVFRINDNKILNHLEDPDYASTWDPKWYEHKEASNCRGGGFSTGPPAGYNPTTTRSFCEKSENAGKSICKKYCLTDGAGSGHCDSAVVEFCAKPENTESDYCACQGAFPEDKIPEGLKPDQKGLLRVECLLKSCTDKQGTAYKRKDQLTACPPLQICNQNLNTELYDSTIGKITQNCDFNSTSNYAPYSEPPPVTGSSGPPVPSSSNPPAPPATSSLPNIVTPTINQNYIIGGVVLLIIILLFILLIFKKQ